MFVRLGRETLLHIDGCRFNGPAASFDHLVGEGQQSRGHLELSQKKVGSRATKFGSMKNPPRRYRVFSRLELTLHGSLALSLAADVVVLPLHTRH